MLICLEIIFLLFPCGSNAFKLLSLHAYYENEIHRWLSNDTFDNSLFAVNFRHTDITLRKLIFILTPISAEYPYVLNNVQQMISVMGQLVSTWAYRKIDLKQFKFTNNSHHAWYFIYQKPQ